MIVRRRSEANNMIGSVLIRRPLVTTVRTGPHHSWRHMRQDRRCRQDLLGCAVGAFGGHSNRTRWRHAPHMRCSSLGGQPRQVAEWGKGEPRSSRPRRRRARRGHCNHWLHASCVLAAQWQRKTCSTYPALIPELPPTGSSPISEQDQPGKERPLCPFLCSTKRY
jgi:hypothetical protein